VIYKLNYKLDYNELLSDVVERMKEEHLETRRKLDRIQYLTNEHNLPVAYGLLALLKQEVLRHAVEEEAIVARVIMKYFKDESAQSIEILRGHREISHFFNEVLPSLPQMDRKDSEKKISEFVFFLAKHQGQEEEIVFPLALKHSRKLPVIGNEFEKNEALTATYL
jgi:hypothetical protein